MLLAFLDYQRESMVRKLDGLSEEQARFEPTPASNSIIALLSHLGYVERWWFQKVFAGAKPQFPWSKDDSDADFRVTSDRTIDDLITFYRTEWERSNEIARAAPSLDEPAASRERRNTSISLRWILNHMIEETARHAGHADITRELIDGSIGI